MQRTVGNRAVRQLFAAAPPAQRAPDAPRNQTGLSSSLKANAEQLSALSLDDVQVHYNSAEPAKVQARAYAQGSDIHVGPGQERHLPHEVWHVVQQKRGQVSPVRQVGGVLLNDDPSLEREADVMGARLQFPVQRAANEAPAAGSAHGSRVIQRVVLTSTTGHSENVPIDDIVKKLNVWMIQTLQADRKTQPPVDLGEHTTAPGTLNWSESYQAGHPRPVGNAFDLYRLMREAKSKPGYLFQLPHLAAQPNSSSQLASSALKTNENATRALMDGLVRPPDDLAEAVKGKGVAYSEMKESFNNLKAKPMVGGPRTDAELGQAHLDLLAGTNPAGFHNDEIKKMYYHLTVLMAAEGRRSAGAFPFAPITLQNLADGHVTSDELFSGDKDSAKAHPAGWTGSKNPLEQLEAHFAAALPGTALPTTADPKRVLDKMRKHVELFLRNRHDFSAGGLAAIPGANFTNKDEALQAVVNLIREQYFSSIPAMYDPPPPGVLEPEPRRTKRKEMDTGSAQWGLLHATHTGAQAHDMNAESLEIAKTDVPEFLEDATHRGQGPRREHHRRVGRVIGKNKKRLAQQASFSDSASEDELDNKMEALLEDRENNKRRTERSAAFIEGETQAQTGEDLDPAKFATPDKQSNRKDYELSWKEERDKQKSAGYTDGAGGKDSARANKFYLEGHASGTAKRKEVLALAATHKEPSLPMEEALPKVDELIKSAPTQSAKDTLKWAYLSARISL